MAKGYDVPPVTWLRVVEYMHGGLEYFLGGEVRAGGRPVICVRHLQGARDALRMPTYDDMTLDPVCDAGQKTKRGGGKEDGNAADGQKTKRGGGSKRLPWELAMSDTRRSIIDAGLTLDAAVTEQLYGLSREELRQYMPIECPKLCMAEHGLLRPWTKDVCFSEPQARALKRLLREVYWQGVEEYAETYARRRKGEKYAVVEMVEDFCEDSGTPETYIEAIRREWQRRAKRMALNEK